MHIGQELPMMYCNFVVNVKFVLKTTPIHHFQTLTMLMPTDQHLSMVLILVKLRDIPILLLLITIHLQCLNIHCLHWLPLQWLLLSRPFLVIQEFLWLWLQITLCVSPVRNSRNLPNLGTLPISLSPRYPKGNAHAEKAVGMVKQIYNHCEDPLYGMLILKTVPLLNVKESPDKIFFGRSLHTNLPKPGMVHTEYEDRYINRTLKEICQTLKILL